LGGGEEGRRGGGEDAATAAITNLHNMTVDSRTLRVELARADKEAASGAKPY
jgi:hypothetical protein